MTGQLIRRGERKWLVRIFLGSDPATGKRRYHNHMVHGPKKDAERYRTAAMRGRDLGTFVEPARMTLDAYLDKWLEEAAKPRVRSRTHEDYSWLLKAYVRPALGGRRLVFHLPWSSPSALRSDPSFSEDGRAECTAPLPVERTS